MDLAFQRTSVITYSSPGRPSGMHGLLKNWEVVELVILASLIVIDHPIQLPPQKTLLHEMIVVELG
jgi:hypothetical protein